MPQLLGQVTERRKDPRFPRAFAFWFRHEGRPQRISAWMLNVSAGGAAFLTPADQVPPVGQRIELIEMPTTDPMVREDAGTLPRAARVLRHDPGDGPTRKVAVRFESDTPDPLAVDRVSTVPVTRPPPEFVRTPPPVVPEPYGAIFVTCLGAGI